MKKGLIAVVYLCICVMIFGANSAHAYDNYDTFHNSYCNFQGFTAYRSPGPDIITDYGVAYCPSGASQECKAICPLMQINGQWPSTLEFVNIYYSFVGTNPNLQAGAEVCALHLETGQKICTDAINLDKRINIIDTKIEQFSLDWHYALYLKITGQKGDLFYGYKSFWTLGE